MSLCLSDKVRRKKSILKNNDDSGLAHRVLNKPGSRAKGFTCINLVKSRNNPGRWDQEPRHRLIVTQLIRSGASEAKSRLCTLTPNKISETEFWVK